jgi:hypothetical protein
MESYTFKTKDNVLQISVKKEFLEKCPTPDDFTAEELFDTYQVHNFLHNVEEPALIGLVTSGANKNDAVYEYFIDARRVEESEVKNIKFKKEFKTGLNEALKNDE